MTYPAFIFVCVNTSQLTLTCFDPRPEWFGMLYSQADSKKKSNLMMSLFEPGPDPLPWLGKISHLGPVSGNIFGRHQSAG